LDKEKPKHTGLAQQNGIFAQVAEPIVKGTSKA
jgi:hypothetical protein